MIVENELSTHRLRSALYRWIEQRPRMQSCNYDQEGWNADRSRIAWQKALAERLIRVCLSTDGTCADYVRQYLTSGRNRLYIEGNTLHYNIGQYWATEYRNAVCLMLSEALWELARQRCKDDQTPREWLESYLKAAGFSYKQRDYVLT